MGLRATTYDLSRTFELAYEEQDPDADQKRRTTPTVFKRSLVRWVPGWQERGSDVGRRRSDVGGRTSEVGRRRSGVGSRESGVENRE